MRLARANRQMLLLDVQPSYPLGNNAQARNGYGSAASEIVCAALKLHPIAIDGRCEVCFDAEADGVFYEIKSAQRASKVVVYDWRMTKEIRAKENLLYAILMHRAGGCRESAELWKDMAATAEILLAPASYIHALSRLQPLKLVPGRGNHTARFGYNRKGYVEGYRSLPLSHLMELAVESHTAMFQLYGHGFRTKVFICP